MGEVEDTYKVQHIGKVFNHWTVVDFDSIDSHGHMKLTCICICGTKRSVSIGNLKKGTSKCCGCIRKNPNANLKTRFFSKFKQTEGCWNWEGCLSSGYGVIGSGGNRMKAHRVSWEIHNGKIPKQKCVCHKCDNPKCVNPDHLFLGTHQKNMDDMISKGRANKAHGEDVGLSKLTVIEVVAIKRLRERKVKVKDLSFAFNTSDSTIKNILYGRTWRCVDG